MTKQKLQQIVDEAVALHREVAAKTETLKTLKAEIVRESEEHPEEHQINERGSRRWTVTATDGCAVRVNFPATGLISEIDSQNDLAQQCRDLAADHFRRLFATVKIYQLVDDFRTQAAALLPVAKARALIALCETGEGSPRVSFEAAKRPEANRKR